MSLRAPLLLALLTASFAAEDEHAPAVVAPVQVTGRPIPDGPPMQAQARPGDDLSAVLAGLTSGSTLRLEPGRYDGSLVIDRPVILEGEGAELVGPGFGSVLIVAADDVQVRGLSVRGSGADTNVGDAGVIVSARRFLLEGVRVRETLIGMDLRQAKDGVIRGCRIEGNTAIPMGRRGDGMRLWESDDNLVEDNELIAVRDLVVWYSEGNTLRGNRVRDARYGTHFMHSDRSRVEGNFYEDNIVGIFVMYSDAITLVENRVVGSRGEAGVGFGFKESSDVLARGNALLGNTTGLYLDGTPHRFDGSARFDGNLVAQNDTGMRLHGSVRGAAFDDNTFYENGVAVSADGGADATRCVFTGNHWTEYAGYDLDKDGYGDVAFELRSTAGSLRDRRPELSFFQGTLAAGLLDLLAAAFPMFAPAPVLTDARPRMHGL